jgi:hypothetical protein
VRPVWRRVGKFHRGACKIADRHYSRRKPGSSQFMPPGQTVVLLSECGNAVFGWWRPHPDSGIVPANKLNAWTCTIFRNEGTTKSSVLILAAEKFLLELDIRPDPDIYATYVWDRKVASANPGYCFKCAGYTVSGRSADNKKTLLTKPFRRAHGGQDREQSCG